MYKVWFTNFGYFAEREFTGIDSAIEFAKSKGFEVTIFRGKATVGAWSPLGGFRYF